MNPTLSLAMAVAPAEGWARHAVPILDVGDNQVRALRKRMLIAAFERGDRKGVYWGIRTDVGDYGLASTLPCPQERTLKLAATPTRLVETDERLQEQIINWGYAVCDAGMRAHVMRSATSPAGFRYPGVGV